MKQSTYLRTTKPATTANAITPTAAKTHPLMAEPYVASSLEVWFIGTANNVVL